MKRALLPLALFISVVALAFTVTTTIQQRSALDQVRSDLKATQQRLDDADQEPALKDLRTDVNQLGSRVDTLDKTTKGFGVCVDSQTSGNAYYVSSVGTPQILNGAKQCLDGSFVPVVPEEYKP